MTGAERRVKPGGGSCHHPLRVISASHREPEECRLTRPMNARCREQRGRPLRLLAAGLIDGVRDLFLQRPDISLEPFERLLDVLLGVRSGLR